MQLYAVIQDTYLTLFINIPKKSRFRSDAKLYKLLKPVSIRNTPKRLTEIDQESYQDITNEWEADHEMA